MYVKMYVKYITSNQHDTGGTQSTDIMRHVNEMNFLSQKEPYF